MDAIKNTVEAEIFALSFSTIYDRYSANRHIFPITWVACFRENIMHSTIREPHHPSRCIFIRCFIGTDGSVGLTRRSVALKISTKRLSPSSRTKVGNSLAFLQHDFWTLNPFLPWTVISDTAQVDAGSKTYSKIFFRKYVSNMLKD